MSDADNARLSIGEEGSYGEVVVGPLELLRFTSESLQQETSTIQSKEIRPDRQVTDITRSNLKASGGLNFEMSYKAQDRLMKAALMADSGWTSLPTMTADTISAATADDSFNDSANGFVTAGFEVGQRILVSGFTEAGNNGLFTIATVAAGKITVTGDLTDEAAGDSVTMTVKPKIVESTISAAAADNSYNDSADGFVTAGFAANQWVKVSGFTTAANNGYRKIVSVTAGKMIVSAGTLEDEAEGDEVTILRGDAITNGSTAPSFNIEREYTDLTNELALFTGMTVDQMSMSITAENIITGNFTLVGKSETSLTASNGSGYSEAPTNDVMNAVDNVLDIVEGGADFSAKSLSIQLQNNLRARLQIGSLGAISIGKGKIAVTGTLQAYFATKTLMDKYLNFTKSSLAIVLKDSDGNAYVLDLPQIKYTTGQRVAGGENQDIMADMNFAAYRNPDENVTIRIVRFDAA